MTSEKINIYVPENVGKIIDSDSRLFEVFKKDGYTVNKNKFLSKLILGFYSQYMDEYQQKYDSIKTILNNYNLLGDECANISSDILREVVFPKIPTRKGKNPRKLSLKPTNDTISLITKIFTDLGSDDYISQFFCRMFMCYCEKPINERERIIFKKNYEFLRMACERGQAITFTTIWNRNFVHKVIPYKVVVGQGEMFNYLICVEENKNTKEQEAKSYRINRITDLNLASEIDVVSPKVKKYLNLMEQYGPQFAINDLEESCVRISDQGEKVFNRIYYGRPEPCRIEDHEDGHYYYFKNSKDQIFLYFIRFESNDAEIIAPMELRERIIKFHANALSEYKSG